MYPCGTCGSTSVNAIGYCTGCGAFRGAEAGQPGYPQQPQQPQSYEHYQQSPYQQHDPNQYAAAGQYPPQQQQYAPQPQPYQQPYQQPYAPPPQQRRSGSGLVIGIVVGVLVLLLGGGAAVALVIANGDDDPDRPTTTGSTGTPSASGSAPPDPCVIGTWVETQSNYDLSIDDQGGTVRMSTSGAIQRFKEDGTGELDMSAGTVATGTANGKRYERTTTGKITFKYHPQANKIYYTDVVGSGTSIIKVDGVAGSPIAVSGSLEPDTYTCSGDTFVQSGTGYRIQLKRQ